MVIEGTHYSPNCSCKNCKRIKIMDKKASLQKESELKKKKYIVRHWFMMEDVFEDIDKARRAALELGKMDKRKDIEVVEVEITEKVL